MKQNPLKEETLPAGLGKVLLSHLIPDAKNPQKDLKKGDPEFEKIQNSIGKFGQLDPIIFNTRTRKILGGHQRLKVLDSQGYTELYTVALGAYTWAFAEADLKELSEKEENAANIALNKAQGDWNIEQLTINLQELKLDDMLEFTGFDDIEFDGMLRDLHKDDEPQDTEPQISRAEELRKEWGTELGQMWQCGDHRVICGDCTDPDVVARVMQGEKADMISTDPPYGMDAVKNSGVLKRKYKDIPGDNNTNVAIKAFSLFNAPLMIWWGANYYSQILPPSPCWLVWDKNNGSSDQMDAELAWTNLPGVTRLFKKASEKTNRTHPTQKPIDLIVWYIERFGSTSQIILDPFLGSGTTMIACENLGRKARGCEIDPGYVAVILQRYKDTFPGKEIKLVTE